LEDPNLFVFVLIDEVESLTRSRSESKNEPSDGMRVVNTLLTQIDQLKSYHNVLILATSNLRNSIDEALLDRADVSYEVGLPTQGTAYDILFSCIMELKDKGLIHSADSLVTYKNLNFKEEENKAGRSSQLLEIVMKMEAKSARYLRKIPFQASMKVSELPSSLTKFLNALK
jgi:SpoVK/Ycf46/Vps4 family AAA+-type ATPase